MADRTEKQECRRWVAYRLGQLGDVTLCTGVLARLAAERGWEFVFVTRRGFADVFKYNPHVGKVICLDEEDLTTSGFTEFGRRLSKDYTGWGLLDLHGSLRSRILRSQWQGPVLQYEKMSVARRVFLWSRGLAGGKKLREYSVPQRYYMALRGLVRPETLVIPPAAELAPRIWLSADERMEARARLDALLGRNSAPIALHPFATHALKSWPAPYWRELAERLEAESLPWIILGKGEALFGDNAVLGLKELTNGTTLRETCALLSWCRVLLTGDSGPMHLASAVGTPVVALFGPTTREWGFFPQGPHDRVLEKDLPCRPCSLHGRKPCGHGGSCLSAIGVDEVYEALLRYPAVSRP